ncbi:response regulator [Zavarzinia compransoris]|uniref:Response regulator n=1 Tax=Zavarzinia compransoris TaxID=1264899 RepID=A0A317E6U2_9PROT|nr:response regulator [Zavarzinia compransoris]PWR21946.1 response regulator [Zavarzinia compransoris]TDP47316.1 response regulator receiver domain-containing protein [Zavarzinia compransoris]
MTDLKFGIAQHLPYLRRYARALTGNQGVGDGLIRAALQSLASGKAAIDPDRDLKPQLYSLVHAAADAAPATAGAAAGGGRDAKVQAKLGLLPSAERRALLLTSLEAMTRAEVASVLGRPVEEVSALLDHARDELARQDPARVLVIEDEPIIALHIAEIVREAGHEVVGIATRKSEAVALAAEHRPGLVLADIQLDDGSTGIEAAQEILQSLDVPVIFVTAFPERLLTGERMEPTFLVSKPFDPETLVVTIGQALFHHPGR